MKVRLAAAEDAAAFASIYAPYVTGTAVSFELDPPDEAAMRARILGGGALYPWLVACDDSEAVLGYASASAFRTRRAYRFTVETSVYLAADSVGRGVGRRLYGALLATLEAQGFAQAVGAISLPNPASVALHRALGFTEAGVYREVGHKFGRWHSVGLWQRPLAPLTDRPKEPKPVAEVWDRIKA
ncbi:MAG TPA: GNAT family N-acetyltransferase [Allosphingosinicella sp.]|nr:GNAT family N-acetyltransferase [Allosphingosinicella sp.]